GESGEVVFTTLTREAMPLIRYRTGDTSRFIPGPCPCGTVLRRLAHVHERLDGSVTLAGGGILRQRDLDEALLALPQLADFQVSFSRSDTGCHLEVRVRGHDDSPGPPEAQIMRALLTIPVLRSGTARGGVSVAVLAWEPVDGNRQTGTGKRKIEYSQGAM
ncbi:MAG: phenylacetate--CoA ligase family protein, partial [Thermoleophilia bacterium]|nr:phenylacetate--CoA ligase family protein [Thermoleophilia bacterium]